MQITYEKLTEVSDLAEVSATTYVLVEEDGVIKKILSDNLFNEVSNDET